MCACRLVLESSKQKTFPNVFHNNGELQIVHYNYNNYIKNRVHAKAVARFVIIFNFQYDWMEKDELKVTSPEHKQDVVRC